MRRRKLNPQASYSTNSSVTLFAFLLIIACTSLFARSSFSLHHGPLPMDAQDESTNLLENVGTRMLAARPVAWPERPVPIAAHELSQVRILGINDFHGQLSAGRRIEDRSVGGAAVLAAYLKAASATGPAFIAHAGDHVGASPPESSFFQDEPSIEFLNLLGNEYCSTQDRMNEQCNLVGTPGNHEFDEGKDEMLRLIQGGNHPKGPFFRDPYEGAHFPYVSSNVLDLQTKQTLLPPFVIKEAEGVRIAFIGAVLNQTPTLVTPTGVAELQFLDEADSINRQVRWLREHEGIRTFIVLIHQGGRQSLYQGITRADSQLEGDEIIDIVSHLDDDVDVVVSGHSHTFTNALITNRHGTTILLTQAFAYGTAYANISLTIDRRSRDVVAKQAAIVTTFADTGPGRAPDPIVAELVARAETKVAPQVKQIIATAAQPLSRIENAAGESMLGDLIADAQRAALETDFAFMNPRGIRADLPAGPLTYRDLFLVHPFGNTLVRMMLTGQQVYDLMNQQWLEQPRPRMLNVSGLTYVWDHSRPSHDRIVEIRKDGVLLNRKGQYSVTVNDFLAAGGDNFSVLARCPKIGGGPADVDALIAYLRAKSQPFSVSDNKRVSLLGNQ